MRRSALVGLMLAFVFSIAHLEIAAGQADPFIRVNLAEVQFPNSVFFQLEIEHESEIVEVTLYYRTSGRTCQQGTARKSFEFEPAPELSLDWGWEWKRSGIVPPGSTIWWQWEITDSTGRSFASPENTVTVQDQRHTWQLIDEDGVMLQWYIGDQTFGRNMHTIVIEALDRLGTDMGFLPEGIVHITIYPTTEDLREALLHTSEWTGGVAYPDYDSFLTGIFPGEEGWAASVIPHELAHLIVDARFFNCRGAFLPTWFSEGLAEYAEDPLTSGELGTLEMALEADNLPPLRSLARRFSAYGDEARLAYRHSAFVVAFLYEVYGAEQVLALLDTLKEGITIDDALETVFGFDTDGLDSAWRESLGFPPLPESGGAEATPTRTSVPTVALFSLDIQPTPTNTQTPPPPTPTATQKPAPTQVSVQDAAPTPILTPIPTIPTENEANPLASPLVWFGGVGGLVLLLTLIYLRSSRR